MPKRGADDMQPAVAFALAADDQRMNRCIEAERGRIFRHVMHLAVGDEDGAGDAFARHVGERPFERREKRRAFLVARIARNGYDARFDAVGARETFLKHRKRGVRFARAVANVLALAAVDHDGGDVGHRFAVFLPDGRVQHRQHEDGECGGAQRCAARAAPCRIEEHRNARQCQQHNCQQRYDRVEDDVPGHPRVSYCPRRSRRAGTCT